ncbi:MAG: hypothetical protein GXO68_05695 [Crenarchaeota archaeon]|nr:hypothetical protein [Thermoproteota archaeon]
METWKIVFILGATMVTLSFAVYLGVLFFGPSYTIRWSASIEGVDYYQVTDDGKLIVVKGSDSAVIHLKTELSYWDFHSLQEFLLVLMGSTGLVLALVSPAFDSKDP